ncbi:MAG TPA: PhoX family phosphatase, partial [Rhizobiales bacterium]|nr:PhoX family phosphatase [Hyphomicrobiales bacterium]
MAKGHGQLSFDEFDDKYFPRPPETGFDRVITRAISRRGVLGLMGAGVGALAVSPGAALAGKDGCFDFEAVAANTADTVTVPRGFKWHVVLSWGDPLWPDAPPFDPQTRGTGASQERAFGDNNDGMHLFERGGRTILAVNNEYTNLAIIHGNRKDGKPVNADDIRKSKAAHGVTICEVQQIGGKWSIIPGSPFTRRITPETPMQITGPAAGHDMLKTKAGPTGTRSLGTWANCANGATPWGTYLTCEENFNGYYSTRDKSFKPTAEMIRYGIAHRDWGYQWAMADDRFDVAKNPNEPNRSGYVVEIDPFDPDSTPKKRTALGRFKHENAELVINSDGRIVVYMGDDERGEFIYRFVSDEKYIEGGDNTGLLDNGTLYAARFNDDQTGKWQALTPETTGMPGKAEICLFTRIAASAVGATTMDRPEWIAANPLKAEVMCALTHNRKRGRNKTNAGGDPMILNGPNPRARNRYGQIVRWRPDGGDHAADSFTWDLFVLAGNPLVHTDERKGSANVTPANMFNSPDGLKFDSSGMLWIETDGYIT